MFSIPLRLALGLCMCLSSLPAWATLSNAQALNLAGQQRMLSQRIAKSYLMLGSQVRPDVANRQLDQSLATFESNQLALDDYAPNPAIRQQLQSAGALWQDYRQLALSPADHAHAIQLMAKADELLAQSEKTVSLIEANSGDSTAQLINRSGRQRMLSQRIASLYLALSWKLPGTQLQTQFQQAVDEFDQALKSLQGAPQNNVAINAGLDKAQAQWTFSKAGFRLSDDQRYVPTLIATTTETLLQQMEALTLAYTQLLSSTSASTATPTAAPAVN